MTVGTTVGSMPQETHVPSHPDALEVRFASGEFNSSLHAAKSFKAGDFVCSLVGWIPATRTRTSFQCGEKEHNEFNNDVVFANHSCAPNVGLDLSSPNRDEWKVVAITDIQAGEPITWFYPSTEWDAWGGGFPCGCGAKTCLGTYHGSKALPKEILEKYQYINPHVWRLVAERDGGSV